MICPPFNFSKWTYKLPDLFKKALKNGTRAEAIVSDAKPATISYNYRTEKLSGKVYYKVENEYGVLLSF